LSVCPSDYSQTCERILTKFFGGVGHDSRTKWYNFGGDPDHTSDPGVQSPKSGSSGSAEVCAVWAYLVFAYVACGRGSILLRQRCDVMYFRFCKWRHVFIPWRQWTRIKNNVMFRRSSLWRNQLDIKTTPSTTFMRMWHRGRSLSTIDLSKY